MDCWFVPNYMAQESVDDLVAQLKKNSPLVSITLSKEFVLEFAAMHNRCNKALPTACMCLLLKQNDRLLTTILQNNVKH